MNIIKLTTSLKAIHWLFVICFLILGFTAITNTTFYSNASIMKSFEVSFPLVGLYNIEPYDQLFISRIERRDMWEFHFWIGIFATALVVLRFFLNKNISKFYMSFYLIFIVMLISGFPLFIRTFIEVSSEIQIIVRTIHSYSSWVFLFFAITHIVKVIVDENKNDSNRISEMFKIKKNILPIILIGTMSTTYNLKADDNYDEAMLYLNGKKGVVHKRINMPNCPYDRCKKADKMKKEMHVETEDNQQYIIVKKIDYKSGLKYLNKSIKETNNPDSVKKALSLLIKKLNYKDSNINETLLKRLKIDLGLSVEDYKKLMRTYLIKSKEFKECKGYYQYADFNFNGYMGIFKKNDKLDKKKIYTDVVASCSNNPYLKMLAKSKAR